jgi:HD-like signal output (HDOD) protein
MSANRGFFSRREMQFGGMSPDHEHFGCNRRGCPLPICAMSVGLNDSELAELAKTLPASPRLLAELAPRLQQVEVPLSEITTLLRRDASLTARLIAMANSAAYARAEPAASLEEAVACIGYREVYRLVGAVAATQLADEKLAEYQMEPRRVRENALFVALVMEELADAIGRDPRAAYTMGLLRSMGKVVLDRHAKSHPPSAPLDPAAPGGVAEWERTQWGISNPEVAAKILTAWRFPAETVTAILHHYAPSADDPAAAHLLNLAAGAADLRGYGFPGEEGYWLFTPENFALTGVDEGKLVWAGERAFQTLGKICAALG